MLSQRPFRDRDDVFDSAERIWWDLTREDWLEAFAAHPRIGRTKDAHDEQRAKDAYEKRVPETRAGLHEQWSAGEQARVAEASDALKAELARANEEYQRRFGYIYIVCATGKRAEELLDICRGRLANAPELEIRVAASEQAMITRIRLDKLLALGA